MMENFDERICNLKAQQNAINRLFNGKPSPMAETGPEKTREGALSRIGRYATCAVGVFMCTVALGAGVAVANVILRACRHI